MEKVVYILGAGFSAPLGLPVMSNFYQKSKNQFAADKEKYSAFEDVFKEIRSMSITKNFYYTDLRNIEDILSILQFRTKIGTSEDINKYQQFLDYIKAVINHHSPSFAITDERNDLWIDDRKRPYIAFVASLLRCSFQPTHTISPEEISGYKHIYRYKDFDWKDVEYSIITLNYDEILEKIENHFDIFTSPRKFCRKLNEKDTNRTFLAKIHGSVDGEIVPPVSNKGIGDGKLADDWKVAYKVLSEANAIRILGYSFPKTDAYLKYLLRATAIESTDLKQIDVLCLDPSHKVKKRCDKLIALSSPDYRFMNASIEDYLKFHYDVGVYHDNVGTLLFDRLEQAHEGFFSTFTSL